MASYKYEYTGMAESKGERKNVMGICPHGWLILTEFKRSKSHSQINWPLDTLLMKKQNHFKITTPNHHSHPGTILPCKILFSPRTYTSQKRSINWRICHSLSWPRIYTSQKRSVDWRICNSLSWPRNYTSQKGSLDWELY